MRLLFSVVLCLTWHLAFAAPLERDLGGGLIYFRVPNVPADLPASASTGTSKRAYILDLRYAHGDPASTSALTAWLKPRASARTPIFILANAETHPALLALLSRHDPNGGILLLGAASPGFTPDIAIKISPEAERRAFEAFETQADPLAFLKENSAKVRNDEARLSRDHVPGGPPIEEVTADPTPASGEKSSSAPTPTHPVDYVLQRAFHLHRTLVALKKI